MVEMVLNEKAVQEITDNAIVDDEVDDDILEIEVIDDIEVLEVQVITIQWTDDNDEQEVMVEYGEDDEIEDIEEMVMPLHQVEIDEMVI